MSTRTHLDTIFRKRFTKPFRRVAEWRKARQLERQMRASRLSKVRLEPLEQRVLLSADLNVVIDGFLDTLNPAVPQPAAITMDYVADDGVITIGNSVGGVGADLALEGVRLTFGNLIYDGANARWSGQVGVEAASASLFPGLLDIEVTDGDDSDAFAVAGVIDLVDDGNDQTADTLHLDDIDAEAMGWPSFLDINIVDLEMNFPEFRVNNDTNSLHLEVALTGFDTGNDALNDLLSADNPFYGLNVQGSASVTLGITEIEEAVETGQSGDIVGALQDGLTAAMASSLDGLTGSITGKLFKVGDISAGFIYQKVTVDPDASGPLSEKTATYLAVEGGFSIGDEVWGGRSTKLHVAFAVSDLGPLQFFISGGPIKRFEPTTGLTIEEAHLGVRFNSTIEDLQTETDFEATAATVQPIGSTSRITMTIAGHDLAIGDEFRIRNAGNNAYNGEFTVFAVNGDQVTYEVAGNPGLFVGDAEVVRLTITDPFDLRDEGLESGIAPPDDIFVWRDQLDAAVANQIAAGDDIWGQLFGEVIIGGGATLSIDPIPDTVMQMKVDLMIDTDFQILLRGTLSLADGFVEVPATWYADLTDLFSGSGRFLFLADIPEAPVIDPLLVLHGEMYFEPLEATNLLDATVTAGSGFWDLELGLALDHPSDEYIIGDHAVVFGSDESAFDGTYEVIAINDDANTITVRSTTDPGTWSPGSVRKIANQNVLLGGFRIGLEGGLDLNIPHVTTLTLEGGAQIDFRIPDPALPEDLRMDFSFEMALSETHIGDIGNANGNFHVTVDADVAPDAQHPIGGVEIWGAALLTTNFEFLESIGLFANADALLRINSSGSDKPAEHLRDVHGNIITVALPAESFALRLDGSVDFRIDFNGNHTYALNESAFLAEGIFVLEFSAEQGFNVAIFNEGAGGTIAPATLQLGPSGNRLLTFEVFGFLAIRDDGFAANMVLTTERTLPLGLASVDATAVLIVNTTGDTVTFVIPGGPVDPDRSGLSVMIPKAAPTNPSAVLDTLSVPDLINGSAWIVNPATPGSPYGVLFLDGSLELLSVLDLNVSGYVLLSASVVSLQVEFSTSRNFLNLASASASGSLFFSSEGEFEVIVHGSVQLGPDWININGSADLTISYLDNNGKASGGNQNRVMNIVGLLSVGATVFGVDIGHLDLGIAYNSISGEITVSVPYPEPFWDSDCWDTFLGEICVYYPNVRTSHFTISVGTLTAHPVIPPPPVLGQVDSNGVLTLNVGVNAAARNLLVDETDELVIIDRIGNSIQISMFGISQTFNGVTSILIADMADGNDFVDIRPGVFTPLEVHFGDGNDRLRNMGTGRIVAFGDDNNDRLEAGSADDHLYGGNGDDLIDGGAGQDWIEGGADSDTLIGGDGSDTIWGGTESDLIAGDLAVVEGDFTTSIFRSIASAAGGNDAINGGDGIDILFGSSGSDTISGNAGQDFIFGDDGKATIQPGAVPVVTQLSLGLSGDDVAIWNVGDGNDIVDGQLGSDTLQVFGTGNADQLTFSAKVLGFTLNTGLSSLSVDGVETSTIDARQGGDTITVNDLASSVLKQINAGLGSDSVQDAVVINGANNADVFSIAPVGNVIRVQKTGGVTIDISGATTGSGNDSVTLNTAGGDDTVNVLGTRAGTLTAVNGDQGNDTVNVGSLAPAAGGTLSGIAGLLTINGNDPSGDGDVLSIDNTGDSGPNTGTLTNTTITGLGMTGSITYGTFETLKIDLGSGADTFTILGTHTGATRLGANAGNDTVNVKATSGVTTVNSGLGDDTVNIGSLAPAAGGTVNAINAATTINGDGGNDTLIVDDSGDAGPNTGTLSATTITDLGMGGGITYGTMETLNIDLGSGADIFTIQGTHIGVTRLGANAGNDTVNVKATSGATTVNSGLGDDTVNVGSLAPAAGGTVNALSAALTINGEGGNDTLNVDDSGDAGPNTGTLSATTITGLGMGGGITYGTFEALNIDLGSGADSFTIQSTYTGPTRLGTSAGNDTVNVRTTSGATTINGGLGDDTVNVGSLEPATGGTVNAINAAITINGEGGNDTLNVDDTGDTGPNSGALTATTITGLGLGSGITYGTIEALNIDLGSGDDTFTIQGTHTGTTRLGAGVGNDTVNVGTTSGATTINGGLGDDTVNVGSLAPAAGGTLNAINAPVTIDGEAGNDTLLVDDRGDANPNSGLLTEITLSGLGMASGITYGHFETLEISLGSGGNHFDILGTMRDDGVPTITRVTTGSGNDSVTVLLDAATDGPLEVDLQAGNDTLDASSSSLGIVVIGGLGSDFIVGGSGADLIYGDLKDNPSLGDPDVIHGNAGNDTIYGAGGADEIYGEQGNDTIFGDDGNDILLGDAGQVNARNVVLTDEARVTGELPLNAEGPQNAASLESLLNADLVLLVGRTGANGLTDTRVLLVELTAAGNDTISGGQGDDALFGQRGDDVLNGDAGDDLLSAGAGDDKANGGTGDDTVVGDELYIDSPAATVLNVAHGLLINGTVVVPTVQVVPGTTPNAVASTLPFVFNYGANRMLPANDGGSAFLAYASVVTDFSNHIGQLRGNDVLSGGEGTDSLVGDDQVVVSREFVFDAQSIARAEALTRGLLDVSDDFSDLIHRQYGILEANGVPAVPNVLTIGSDVLEGDDGKDVLIGDDSLLVELKFTLPVGMAGDFMRFTEGVTDAGDEVAHGLADLAELESLSRAREIILSGNDTIRGGTGNDLIVGDDFILRTSAVTLVAGGSTRSFGKDDAWRDSDWTDKWNRDNRGAAVQNLKVGADVIWGDEGVDVIWGDDVALASSSITKGRGLGILNFRKARGEVRKAEAVTKITDSDAYWLAPLGTFHDHNNHYPVGKHINFDNGDQISGGEGDDIIFGQDGDDTLSGNNGNDWLVGGEGKDNLEGGAGKNKSRTGDNHSIKLRNAVGTHMINWDAPFKSFGLKKPPFSGMGLAQGEGQNNQFDWIVYSEPGK